MRFQQQQQQQPFDDDDDDDDEDDDDDDDDDLGGSMGDVPVLVTNYNSPQLWSWDLSHDLHVHSFQAYIGMVAQQ